ncbi:Short-chain dehydrogenase/reductase [Thalictrum thalictroides]|uniref:Short-chain dehydrogenase/reductase n=1 Tax=Thalictrum thalictroides TaxID=46969 RepID=A0A7J6VVC6_THATH|nr:Short-chain dehydrogenase/reductase [Thalictrum thalictroides]
MSCRSFRSEDGVEFEEKDKKKKKDEESSLKPKKSKGALYSLKSFLLKVSGTPTTKDEYRNAVAKAEDIFFACATQVGRYLVTMMSTGVILATGFQLSGGDSQLDTLIWYSWLGGVIIGTMIGANMVLEEHYKQGPRNVVITGSFDFLHDCYLT